MTAEQIRQIIEFSRILRRKGAAASKSGVVVAWEMEYVKLASWTTTCSISLNPELTAVDLMSMERQGSIYRPDCPVPPQSELVGRVAPKQRPWPPVAEITSVCNLPPIQSRTQPRENNEPARDRLLSHIKNCRGLDAFTRVCTSQLITQGLCCHSDNMSQGPVRIRFLEGQR